MTSRQPAILEVDSLSKHYADFDLKDVSLSLPKGAIMGLVGTNGAGKSTTIKLILNLIRRDGGSVRIFGKDNIGEEAAVKERIGVVFDECFFHDNLKPSQVSKVMGHIYKDWDEAYFFRLTDRFALPRGKVVKEFSRGMKMKLSIAAALSHHPDLLLLDEPTSGLDPIVRNEILDLFMDFIQDENKSVLLSSHITSDLEKVADYIAYIHGGRILLSDEKDALVERYGVKVDRKLHEEVLERYGKLGIQPYSGFVNPIYTPVMEGGEIVDIIYEYPKSYTEQMLDYSSRYSFLPSVN